MMPKTTLLAALAALAGVANGLGSTDTITWGGDNSRSGYETNHNLDPAIVGSSQFGQLFSTPLPGKHDKASEQVYSMPLVFTPSGGEQQFVYVATTQNNVYKIDAKTGEIVTSRSLHIPFLTADLDGCVDINPTVGVIGTGVIDPSTETWYIIAKTYENQDGGPGPQGRDNGRIYIHAISTADLSERANFPIDLEGVVARNSPQRKFTGGQHNQRPGLLQQGDYIYTGFGSHCVQYVYTGWVIGWHKTTGQLVERFATQGADVASTTIGGAVWMSGAGITADDSGSIFFATGNGYASQLSTIPVAGFNPPTSLEQAAVHMTVNEDGTLDVADFFIPWEKQALDGNDKDLGTSGLNLLPPQFACGDIKRVGVVTGKSGKTHFLNLDNMGGYRNGAGLEDDMDDVLQMYKNLNSVYSTAGVYPLEGGYIYINPVQLPTNVFKFQCTNGVPSFVKVAESPTANAYTLGVGHGSTTSLDDQPGTGLFWITDIQGSDFKVFDAVPVDGKLNLVKEFKISGITKFTRPVFGDGVAYVAGNGFLYGFGAPTTPAVNCTGPVDFGNVDIVEGAVEGEVSCAAVIDTVVDGIAMATGESFSVTGAPNMPLTLTKGETFIINATFDPTSVGQITDSVVLNTTNSIAGYSIRASARLTGTGISAGALPSFAPKTVEFLDIVTGSNPNGVTDQVTLSNNGNTKLAVNNVRFRLKKSDPWTLWTGGASLQVGAFTVSNIPKAVAKNGAKTIDVTFDSSQSGTFVGYIRLNTNGGKADFAMTATAGPAPSALLEFQTIDGTDWVEYVEGMPFTFGNVTENSSLSLRFRISNTAPAGGNKLSLTVSKPPFGVSGLIRAANQVDLAEGTLIGAGESQTAVLTCNAPKAQWNMEPYNGTARWTLNTNDPVAGRALIDFYCNAVTQQAPPLLSSGLGQLQYAGCFKENNPGRQLESQILSSDTLTSADCIAACAEGGWTFCGTQYHRECWAGNTIPRLKVDETNCNFRCAGAINQVCGGEGAADLLGGSFISLFADVTRWDGNTTVPEEGATVTNPGVHGFVSRGCITEGDGVRALPYGVALEKATVSNCVARCKERGYSMAGLEYGQECWCGNVLGDGAVAVPEAECSMPCKGNSTEFCGAGSRLNLYEATSLPTSSSSAQSSSETSNSAPLPTGTSANPTSAVPTTTTTTTTPKVSTPTGPVVRDTVSKTWQSQGCFTEGLNARALSAKSYFNDDLTLELCADSCSEYTFFGAEYGRECWCGDSIHPTANSTKAAECSMPCGGDASSICGAGSRLQIYKNDAAPTSASITSTATTTTARVSEPTGPVIAEGNANYTYYACMEEPSPGRLLPRQPLNSVNMTIDLCLSACGQRQFAGVEYGRECWCGNALNLNLDGDVPARNVSDEKCGMTCAGNSSEYCGAGSLMSVYSRVVDLDLE